MVDSTEKIYKEGKVCYSIKADIIHLHYAYSGANYAPHHAWCFIRGAMAVNPKTYFRWNWYWQAIGDVPTDVIRFEILNRIELPAISLDDSIYVSSFNKNRDQGAEVPDSILANIMNNIALTEGGVFITDPYYNSGRPDVMLPLDTNMEKYTGHEANPPMNLMLYLRIANHLYQKHKEMI